MELPEELVKVIYDFARPKWCPYKIRWSWVLVELQFRHFNEIVMTITMCALPNAAYVRYFSPILIDFMKYHNDFKASTGADWTEYVNYHHKRVWIQHFVESSDKPWKLLSPKMTKKMLLDKQFNITPAGPFKKMCDMVHFENRDEEFGTRNQFIEYWKSIITLQDEAAAAGAEFVIEED
tara:strand:+ start:198 stop:734 length:537 start_codon:yes stop_codon:yes gene_type:complete